MGLIEFLQSRHLLPLGSINREQISLFGESYKILRLLQVSLAEHEINFSVRGPIEALDSKFERLLYIDSDIFKKRPKAGQFSTSRMSGPFEAKGFDSPGVATQKEVKHYLRHAARRGAQLYHNAGQWIWDQIPGLQEVMIHVKPPVSYTASSLADLLTSNMGLFGEIQGPLTGSLDVSVDSSFYLDNSQEQVRYEYTLETSGEKENRHWNLQITGLSSKLDATVSGKAADEVRKYFGPVHLLGVDPQNRQYADIKSPYDEDSRRFDFSGLVGSEIPLEVVISTNGADTPEVAERKLLTGQWVELGKEYGDQTLKAHLHIGEEQVRALLSNPISIHYVTGYSEGEIRNNPATAFATEVQAVMRIMSK